MYMIINILGILVFPYTLSDCDSLCENMHLNFKLLTS